MKIIHSSKRCHYLARAAIFLIALAFICGMLGCGSNVAPCPSQNLEIRTWYDLNAVRDNRCGNHILMNDLNSSTPGYYELAGPMANGGRGWEPIGYSGIDELKNPFKGTFDGQGYEIHDLFIHDSDPSMFFELGLFGLSAGVIKNIRIVNATVIGVGRSRVGALVGLNNYGAVRNCYSTGNVSGNQKVGGLVGYNGYGTVSDSYSAASVTGNWSVGGLVGENTGNVNNNGTVSNSYSTGNVTGENGVGGLVGRSREYGGGGSTIGSSYSTGTVTGNWSVGGLVGENTGTVSDSFWDTETSGQSTSAGGTGKNTTEMQDITTFSGAGWNIIAVALNETNPAYIWNIANNVTYPFLSWQS